MQTNPLNFNPIFLTNPALLNFLSYCYSCPMAFSSVSSQQYPIFPFMSHLHIDRPQMSTALPSFTSLSNSPFCDQSSILARVKEEELLKFEFTDPKIEYDIIFEKKEDNVSAINEPYLDIKEQKYSIQIKEMLISILTNFNQLKGEELARKRQTYFSHPILLKLFDIIIQRYSSAFKTKDEILKYITRKAFATIITNFKKKNDQNEASLSETLCKRYFKASVQDIEKLGISIGTRENFLHILFPYRKNCKNTERYKVLISKLGCSIEFYQDYCVFLRSFEDIMRVEKERKINLFVHYICYCIEREKLQDILNYKRIPWLDSWMGVANTVAQEISVALKVRATDYSIIKKKNRPSDKANS